MSADEGLWLTRILVVGLWLSWIASFLLVHTASGQTDIEGRIHIVTHKTLFFYAAHAGSIGCALMSGMVALAHGARRRMPWSANFALLVMAYTAVVWAMIGYKPAEIFSSRIFSETGPFVWLILIAGYAGTDERVWPAVDKTIRAIAFTSAAIAVFGLLRPSTFQQYYTFSPFLLYCKDLTVFGGWTLLRGADKRGWVRLAHCIPWGMLVVTAVYAQGRSWLINAGLLLTLYLWLPGRRGESRFARAFPLLASSAGVLLLVLITRLHSRFESALNLLHSRLYEDTRSEQIRDFLLDMKTWDFVFGRGPQGTWYWHGVGNYQFLDNAYLWMLFVGGVPILVGYVLFVVWPAARVFLHRPSGLDSVAACVVVVWAIELTGLSTFTHPSLDEPSFLIALMAGRCHGALTRLRAELPIQRSLRGRYVFTRPV
jgi:hypothetical protein